MNGRRQPLTLGALYSGSLRCFHYFNFPVHSKLLTVLKPLLSPFSIIHISFPLGIFPLPVSCNTRSTGLVQPRLMTGQSETSIKTQRTRRNVPLCVLTLVPRLIITVTLISDFLVSMTKDKHGVGPFGKRKVK